MVAGTFVPKPATEIRSSSAASTQTSSEGDGVPAKVSPAEAFGPRLLQSMKSELSGLPQEEESANKTGTLNSKCAACRCHVHLVQRHFVEGKLYHRSCFK